MDTLLLAQVLLGLLIFALGAVVGSFLNVVVYRLPLGRSVVYPPSSCPRCRTQLKPYDNIPVLGWLWLRGRCRYCRQPISPRYPLVEATTGVLFLLTAAIFGASWQTVGYLTLLSWLTALALIDLDTLTLPNALTQPGLIGGLIFQAGLGYGATGTWSGSLKQMAVGVIGAVIAIWVFDGVTLLASALLGQVAMGGGDAKLAALLGAWLGWQGVLLSSFLACVAGTVLGGGAIALGLRTRRQPLPFGPFLAVGAGCVIFWGDGLIQTYLALFWSR